MTASFSIPLAPPSVNHAYPCARGRKIKSAAYRKFERDAAYFVPRPAAPLLGPLAVYVDFHLKRFSTSDVDNRVKPLLDLLQARGVYENDSQIVLLTARKHAGDDRTEVLVALDSD